MSKLNEALTLRRAQNAFYSCLEKGLDGPPYDPLRIAEMLGIGVESSESVVEARTIRGPQGNFSIQYNPQRPRARMRFSIAHEIMHVLLASEGANEWHRSGKVASRAEWENEMLCNLGAAEFLLPQEDIAGALTPGEFTINSVNEMRKKFDVSVETILLKFVRNTRQAVFVFSASYSAKGGEALCLDYFVPSNSWKFDIRKGYEIPAGSKAYSCDTLGFTAKASEKLFVEGKKIHWEAIAIPAISGSKKPRIVGFASYNANLSAQPDWEISYVTGDATQAEADKKILIAQVMNNKSMIWGAGFSRQLARKYPDAQTSYRDWVLKNGDQRKLGAIHSFQYSENLQIVSMVAQSGFGPSTVPRIRYEVLRECLSKLGDLALKEASEIQIPRIGAGLAGGKWEIIERMLIEEISAKGANVVVVDLPK